MKPRSKKTNAIPIDLIAPCGMNCRLCWGYIREKNRCPGCRISSNVESQKSKYRHQCSIRQCPHLAESQLKYCSGRCQQYPCTRLKRLDKRYRTKYGMSMLGNLHSIHESGIRDFIRKEKERWTCSGCGEMICVHKLTCLSCGHDWLKR